MSFAIAPAASTIFLISYHVKDKKEEFDWQSEFTQLNEQFATLSQEQQEKFLRTWLEMSEETQDKFGEMIEENFKMSQQFIDSL